MELSCSIFAEEVLLALLPLFPLPEEGPLVFATEFGGLFPPLFPFPVLFVPKNKRSSHQFGVLKYASLAPSLRVQMRSHLRQSIYFEIYIKAV